MKRPGLNTLFMVPDPTAGPRRRAAGVSLPAGVLMLAVDHTSAQIAERLDLAVSTVNNVLARVYTKLGIGGRPDLRTFLADRDAPAEPPGPRVLG